MTGGLGQRGVRLRLYAHLAQTLAHGSADRLGEVAAATTRFSRLPPLRTTAIGTCSSCRKPDQVLARAG